MKRILTLVLVAAGLSVAVSLRAAENLRLNPRLDYSSDSQDGPLITGDHMEDGAVRGKPNYVFMFGEGWFNSKRQARRSVSLYEKYRGRVNFVIIDLDRKRPPAQQELVKEYYTGYIPHVVVLDANGKALYNSAGEVDSKVIEDILEKSFAASSAGSASKVGYWKEHEMAGVKLVVMYPPPRDIEASEHVYQR